MTDLDLVISLDGWTRTGSGSLSSGVVLRTRDACFPAEGWTDFTDVVVQGAVQAALKLLRKTARSASFAFMEGPYVVDLQVVDDVVWRAHLLREGRQSSSVVANVTFEVDHFLMTLSEACRALARFSGDQGSGDGVDAYTRLATAIDVYR